MTKYISPIVGAKYHPPAIKILGFLAANTPLHIEWEPTNQADPNAIAVKAMVSDLPAGMHTEAHTDNGKIMLGYLPREAAAKLRKLYFQSATGKLTFRSDFHGPLVEWED